MLDVRLDRLSALGLHGMAKAFAELLANGEAGGLGHHEWLGLLLDRETSWQQHKRFAARLRVAKLRQHASVEDVDYRSPRGLDRALFQKLVKGEWIAPTTIWFSSVRQASARVGWPQRLATKLVATIVGSCIRGHPFCSRISRWPAAMRAIPASYATSAEPTLPSSMIGGLSHSTPSRGMISWKSLKSAMDAAPR